MHKSHPDGYSYVIYVPDKSKLMIDRSIDSVSVLQAFPIHFIITYSNDRQLLHGGRHGMQTNRLRSNSQTL